MPQIDSLGHPIKLVTHQLDQTNHLAAKETDNQNNHMEWCVDFELKARSAAP